MLSFVIIAALALQLYGVLAAPQTFSSNSTYAYPPGPAVTKAPTGKCSNNCSYPQYDLTYLYWSQLYITATYTAETVVLVVNKKNNSTRTTTIRNTEIDFADIATPTNINSDGTVTASVVDYDGSTRTVAYPTSVYYDYAPNITWTGTLSTTVSGVPTCSIAPTGAVAVYPSHPLLPQAVQTKGVNTVEDPRGWTFIAMSEATCGDPDDMLEKLFPDLGIWGCNMSIKDCVSPVAALQTALYLTATSTSTESGEGPVPTEQESLPTFPVFASDFLQTAKDLVPPVASSSPAPLLESIVVPPSPSSAPPAEQPLPTKADVPEASPTTNALPTKENVPEASPTAKALPTKENSPEAPPIEAKPVVTQTDDLVVSFMAAMAVHALSAAGEMAPPTTSAPSVNSISFAPEALVSASGLLPDTPNTPAPASKSIIITPSPAPAAALPTTPVAVLVPVTSTDSKGSIIVSTSPAVVHPVIISSTNAQGSIVLSTSLSTAPVSASLPTVITFTNAQGTTLSSTVHLPAVILATTNAAGSTILTTSSLNLPGPTPGPSAPVPITINGQTVTPNAQSQYIVSGQTLVPGSSITLGSGTSTTVLALQTSSGTTALVYGTSTSSLPSITTPPTLTIGSETITPNPQSQYIISGQTLVPGSSITLGSGTSTTLLALQTSSSEGSIITALVSGTSTSLLPAIPTQGPPTLTIGSQTITPNAQSQYIISDSTLSPGGGPITIGSGASSTVLSLQTSPNGGSITALVYGPSTSVLSPPTPTPTPPPVITFGSETITANSHSQFIFTEAGGVQTLTPGGVVTVSGTEISLAAGMSDVVIGGSSTEALGPYITAGFGSGGVGGGNGGGGGNGTTGTGVKVFASGASAARGGGRWSCMGGGAVWLVLMLVPMVVIL